MIFNVLSTKTSKFHRFSTLRFPYNYSTRRPPREKEILTAREQHELSHKLKKILIFWMISKEEKFRMLAKKSKFCFLRSQNFDFLAKIQKNSSLEIQTIRSI